MTSTTVNTPAPAAGDNEKGRLTLYRKKAREFGESEISGKSARVDFAKTVLEGAFAGSLLEGDAEPLYAEYAAGQSRGIKKAVTAVGNNDGSLRANVSKLRQFIKLGMLPGVNGPDVFDRTTTAYNANLAAENKLKSPYDAYCDVARAQLKSPTQDLTDEEINAVIAKPEPATKEDLDKLVAAYKAAHKLATDIPMDATISARDSYATAIKEAGGEVPAMTKDEKKLAAFMAQAKELGFQFAA